MFALFAHLVIYWESLGELGRFWSSVLHANGAMVLLKISVADTRRSERHSAREKTVKDTDALQDSATQRPRVSI